MEAQGGHPTPRDLPPDDRLLRPDGALFLGAGETMFNIDDRFSAVQAEKTLYYRPKI